VSHATTKDKSYYRVIPRDLFNEANLLKCLGLLWILLEGRTDANFEENDGEPFDVQQNEDDGTLTVVNLPFVIRGNLWTLERPLNSRETWPLYASRDDERVAVFTDGGELTKEFESLCDRKEVQS